MAKLDAKVDASGATRGAREFTQAMNSMQGSTGSTGAAMGHMTSSSKTLSLGIAAAGAAAGAAAIAIGSQLARAVASAASAMVKVASDSDEVRSKFAAVFKTLAGPVKADLEAFGDEVGRSTVKLQEYAASLQDTFVPMGIARDQAADLSVQLVKLGVDVGSFSNKVDAEVIRDFQSALVGNHETVRKYGIVITEADLKQEALNLGLSSGSEELSTQAKLQARLSIIMKGSTDAQGDAARTASGFANQMKRLNDEIHDLRDEFGQQLTAAILAAIEDFGGMDEVLRAVRGGFSAVVEVSKLAIEQMTTLAEVVKNTSEALERSEGILFAAKASWFAFLVEMEKAEFVIRAIGKAIEVGIAAHTAPIDAIARAFGKVADEAGEAKSEIANIGRAFTEAEKSIAAFRKEVVEPQEEAWNLDGLQKGLAAVRSAVRDAEIREQMERQAEAAAMFRDEFDKLTSKLILGFDEQRSGINAEHAAYEKLLGSLVAGNPEFAAFADVLRGVSDALHDQELGLVSDAEAWQRLREEQEAALQFAQEHQIMLRGFEDALTGIGDAIGGAAVGFGDFGEAVEQSLKRMVANMISASFQAAAFLAVIRPLLSGAFGLSGAQIAAIFPQFANLSGSAKGNVFRGGQIERFARGGFPTGIISGITAFPMRGGMGIAGERGPEAGFSASSAIAPLKRDPVTGELGVRAIGGGGRLAGANINITTTVNVGGGGGGADKAFRRSLRHYERELRAMPARIGS